MDCGSCGAKSAKRRVKQTTERESKKVDKKVERNMQQRTGFTQTL